MLARSRESGFTLLETLIALSIMVVAFAAILSIESSSLNASARARQMNVVSMLAKNAMIDAEEAIEGKSFEEVRGEETKAFEPPFQDYKWTRTVKEIKFPNLVPSASKEEGSEGTDSSAETLGKLVTNFLSKALREVTVTVSWQKSGKEQSESITTYWVDLNHEFALQE